MHARFERKYLARAVDRLPSVDGDAEFAVQDQCSQQIGMHVIAEVVAGGKAHRGNFGEAVALQGVIELGGIHATSPPAAFRARRLTQLSHPARACSTSLSAGS